MVRCCIVCGYGIPAGCIMNGCGEYIHYGKCLDIYAKKLNDLPPFNEDELIKQFLTKK